MSEDVRYAGGQGKEWRSLVDKETALLNMAFADGLGLSLATVPWHSRFSKGEYVLDTHLVRDTRSPAT